MFQQYWPLHHLPRLSCLQIVANITAEVNEDIAEPIAIIVVTVGEVKSSRILCGVLYFRSVEIIAFIAADNLSRRFQG